MLGGRVEIFAFSARSNKADGKTPLSTIRVAGAGAAAAGAPHSNGDPAQHRVHQTLFLVLSAELLRLAAFHAVRRVLLAAGVVTPLVPAVHHALL